MRDKDPYQKLLGIYLAFKNYAMIDLKKKLMIFEVEGVRLIQHLDPCQRLRLTEPTNNMEDLGLLGQLYQLKIGNITSTQQQKVQSPSEKFKAQRLDEKLHGMIGSEGDMRSTPNNVQWSKESTRSKQR